MGEESKRKRLKFLKKSKQIYNNSPALQNEEAR